MRFLVPAALAAAAGILVSSAPAQGPARARASAAVVSGTLGDVAPVSVAGDGDTSRSAPSATPKGIALSDGSAAASATRAGGDASARATAEAFGVELLGGAVTADLVRRSATDRGDGVVYAGSVRGLRIGGQKIGDVRGDEVYPLPSGGSVRVNHGGAGLRVRLTRALDGYPAGTSVTVADVSAAAKDGPAATATPTPTATATATPTPTAQATPRPRRPPRWRKRLMGRAFVFPVLGGTRIGGPFGAPRADTGTHQGNDLFADFGTPVVAAADGTVENVGTLRVSGNRLWVYADTGDQFFYAHLSAFATEAVDGARVRKGTVLGFVGNTGDAEPTPPHLHFEIHPNGGKAVDPHPFLVAWQARDTGPPTRAPDTGERPGALIEVRDFIGTG